MRGQSEFVTSYMEPWWAGGWEGPESKPCTISPNFSTAVQSKVYSYPASCSWLWLVHQDHSAYSNDLTPSDYYLFWNL